MAEELVELGRKGCSKGKSRRKGYTTKRGVRVRATCARLPKK